MVPLSKTHFANHALYWIYKFFYWCHSFIMPILRILLYIALEVITLSVLCWRIRPWIRCCTKHSLSLHLLIHSVTKQHTGSLGKPIIGLSWWGARMIIITEKRCAMGLHVCFASVFVLMKRGWIGWEKRGTSEKVQLWRQPAIISLKQLLASLRWWLNNNLREISEAN